MKFIRILVFSLFIAPIAAHAASSEFMMAAQLLAAAKNADVQQVQALVNNGANINFVDSTGVSIVCTALMNNDVRAAQILQMYGADASRCDYQIKQYRNKTKTKGGGGLFSGLSSAQSISLAAAGAAVVVGGLLLLTDVFDPGNDNDNPPPSGNTGGGDGNGGGTVDSGEELFAVPYGPAYLAPDGSVTTSDATYQDNLLGWNPSAGGLRELDFNYFNVAGKEDELFTVDKIGVPVQNYLLMMHGYSALANEYTGQRVFRNEKNAPVKINNGTGGGKPVTIGLVTGNGVNPVGSLGRDDGILYADSANADSTTGTVNKFANYVSVTGAENVAAFDLSGSGTAMNPFATLYQSALGKIVAGWEADRSYGDLTGFVPNAQLGIYRTGNGQSWVNVENPTSGAVVATLTDGAEGKANVVEVGDKITLNGNTYILSYAKGEAVTRPTITVGESTYEVDTLGSLLLGKCDGDNCDDVSDIAMYVGTDGNYYLNTTGGDTIDAVYTMNSKNEFFVQKELQQSAFKNFEALYNARNSNDVLANVSVIAPSRDKNYKTVEDMKTYIATEGLSETEAFVKLINTYYEPDFNQEGVSLTPTQGQYANTMFGAYGSSSPMLIMPAGDFEFDNGAVKAATFENYAPLIYDNNLEHNFMTVVAVMNAKGTAGASSIGDYGNGTDFGPLYLATWEDGDTLYMSRKCGELNLKGEIDPWCFSAAGATSEMAVASAAGAVASLKSAFPYMSNKQIYYLMALTADGYLLKTDATGAAYTKERLMEYLQGMYVLPPEYNQDALNPNEYLAAFAEVYGYGLINLERATSPNHKIYVYDGDKIVSASGDSYNAYWRAAQNTSFKPSSVLNLRGATISAPFFDVIESADGSVSLPRVWENKFTIGSDGRRGLYMGDVLGEFKTRRDNASQTQIGDMRFSMAVSERAYNDNLNGLDNLSLGWTSGKWELGASYQRYLTDGASRFDGLSNPVLGLASNAVVSDVMYKSGHWSFGARAFSGAITDEGLLENDPTISSQYMPARLGLMQGAQTHTAWTGDKFAWTATVGNARETDTLLGAQTDGLLNLGAGNTTYVDALAKYRVNDMLDFTARATFARTVSDDVSGQFILGMSDVYSNAFAFGANIGNFEFNVSQPLAITDGALQYAYAKYDVIENVNGGYELNVVDTHIADLSLRPDMREVRLAGTYRHQFGEWTDGAVGFIYRVNPNHTDDFGNESIFMLKLHHRLGI